MVGKRSPKAIYKALERFGTHKPPSQALETESEAYHKAYDEAMDRINGQVAGSRELAAQAISWITLARRPLTTLEFLHALAIELGESELDEANISSLEDIASVCAGLVTVDEESNIIRLVHYTTQQYFEITHTKWFPKAQTDITKSCLTYLAFDAFETGPSSTDEEFEARLQEHVLYDYAARNWGHHARLASTEVEKSILSFFESESHLSACTQAMTIAPYRSFPSGFSPYIEDSLSQMTGMHVAAHFGLKNIIETLLKEGQDPAPRSSNGSTPLSIAATEGHRAVVQILLTTGKVDPNSKATYSYGRQQTLLSFAAWNGHEEVVDMLLAIPDVDVTLGLAMAIVGIRHCHLPREWGMYK